MKRTRKVPTASITAAKDMGINKNFDIVLNTTIEIASLITDSPKLYLTGFLHTYIIIESIGSTARAPKRARVHTGSVDEIRAAKIKLSITDKSISLKN